MIDSLIYFLKKAEQSSVLKELDLEENNYILVTMHRPSNVDTENGLKDLIRLLKKLSESIKLYFQYTPNKEKFRKV